MRFFPRAAAAHLKCFITLVKYTFAGSIPACSRAWLSSLPAGPTKGCPARSSWSSGCSPTNMICGFKGPSPKTVCAAVFHKSQALQSLAALRSPAIVLEAGSSCRATHRVDRRSRDNLHRYSSVARSSANTARGIRTHAVLYRSCQDRTWQNGTPLTEAA